MKLNSCNIVKLDHSNLKNLMDFFLSNGNLKSEHFSPHPFNAEYLIYLLLNKTRDFYCMMMVDDRVVAYGLLRGWEEGYDIPSLGVAVDREFRGFGIGKFMCDYLHLYAKLKGCEKVRLRVHKENLKAKSLYEKLGYEFKENDEDHLEGFIIL
jgi:ribosomal protein S18 acetylase RimI-like enzyme